MMILGKFKNSTHESGFNVKQQRSCLCMMEKHVFVHIDFIPWKLIFARVTFLRFQFFFLQPLDIEGGGGGGGGGGAVALR